MHNYTSIHHLEYFNLCSNLLLLYSVFEESLNTSVESPITTIWSSTLNTYFPPGAGFNEFLFFIAIMLTLYVALTLIFSIVFPSQLGAIGISNMQYSEVSSI